MTFISHSFLLHQNAILLVVFLFSIQCTTLVTGNINAVSQSTIDNGHYYGVPNKDVNGIIDPTKCTVNNRGIYGQTKALNGMAIQYAYEMETKSGLSYTTKQQVIATIDRAVVNALLQSPLLEDLCNYDRIQLYNNIIPRNMGVAGLRVQTGYIDDSFPCQLELSNPSNNCDVVDGDFMVYPTQILDEDAFRKQVLVQIEYMMNDENIFDQGIHDDIVQIRFTDKVYITDAPITDAPTNAPTDAPTNAPTDAPTDAPTNAPTNAPTEASTSLRVMETDPPMMEEPDVIGGGSGPNAGAIAGGVIGALALIGLGTWAMLKAPDIEPSTVNGNAAV